MEITDKGVVFIDLNEAEDGTLTEIPGTEKLYPADSVIVSISQGPCTTITDSTKNLKTTPRGLFETDEVGRTSIPGIFASGDAVKGARTVVEAVAYSKNVAEAMHEYMQTLPPDLPDEYANVPVAEPALWPPCPFTAVRNLGNTVNLRAGHVRPLPRGSPLPCKRPRVLHKFPGGGGERCPRQARQPNRALGGRL